VIERSFHAEVVRTAPFSAEATIRVGASRGAPFEGVHSPHVGASRTLLSADRATTRVEASRAAPFAGRSTTDVGASRAAPFAGARSPHVGVRQPTAVVNERNAQLGTAVSGGVWLGEAAAVQASTTSKLDAAALRVQGKQALLGLGWKPAIADAAVAEALAALGPTVPLEQLIFEALRRCQRPSTLVAAYRARP
jgi:hypothetical protein